MQLLDNAALEQSAVVANTAMNRERVCVGENSYAKELSFNPVDFLTARLDGQRRVAWLDLCCGTGAALIQAAAILLPQRRGADLKLVGVDLAGMFRGCPPELDFVELKEASAFDWAPEEAFDLITCVHGLHYIGDKLGLVRRAIAWLKPDGVFLAHLDVDNLRLVGGPPGGKECVRQMRKCGLEFDPRKHLLSCHGPKELEFSLAYAGADDSAGPNYTRQEAVDSYYRPTIDLAAIL